MSTIKQQRKRNNLIKLINTLELVQTVIKYAASPGTFGRTLKPGLVILQDATDCAAAAGDERLCLGHRPHPLDATGESVAT